MCGAKQKKPCHWALTKRSWQMKANAHSQEHALSTYCLLRTLPASLPRSLPVLLVSRWTGWEKLKIETEGQGLSITLCAQHGGRPGCLRERGAPRQRALGSGAQVSRRAWQGPA